MNLYLSYDLMTPGYRPSDIVFDMLLTSSDNVVDELSICSKHASIIHPFINKTSEWLVVEIKKKWRY